MSNNNAAGGDGNNLLPNTNNHSSKVNIKPKLSQIQPTSGRGE